MIGIEAREPVAGAVDGAIAANGAGMLHDSVLVDYCGVCCSLGELAIEFGIRCELNPARVDPSSFIYFLVKYMKAQ